MFICKDPQLLLLEYEKFISWIEGWWDGGLRPNGEDLSNHPFVKKLNEIKKLREDFYSSNCGN